MEVIIVTNSERERKVVLGLKPKREREKIFWYSIERNNKSQRLFTKRIVIYKFVKRERERKKKERSPFLPS